MLGLLFFDECFKTVADRLIVEVLQFRHDLGNLLVVREFLGDWILAEIDIREAWHSPQVLQLVDIADIVALEVEDLQVLRKTDIEQLLDRVVRDVELL